jgi:hypothetical protein
MTSRGRLAIVLLMVLAATVGCQSLGVKAPKPPPPEEQAPLAQIIEEPAAAAPEESAFAPGNLRAVEIATEIGDLESISRNPRATDAEKAEALRRLALLHLAPHNPARDLALAAEAQAAYLELQPAGTARQEGEIWLALILERLGSERLLQQQSEKIREKDGALAGLGAEKQRLTQKIAAQETVNAKLKADIEKLKFIDLSVEKKRKSFR